MSVGRDGEREERCKEWNLKGLGVGEGVVMGEGAGGYGIVWVLTEESLEGGWNGKKWGGVGKGEWYKGYQ